MAKRKEIKFQERRGALRGRQNGMEFWIRKDELQSGGNKQEYFVAIYPVSNNPRQVSTVSRRSFDLDGAKEFCQKIAAGDGGKELNRVVAYLVGGLVGFAIGAAFQRFVLENGLNNMNPQICKYCQWKKTNQWRWEEKKDRHTK